MAYWALRWIAPNFDGATTLRTIVPRFSTEAIRSSPAEIKMPSADVGILGKVDRMPLPFIPARKGVCCLGSQVSAWATPPGSQISTQLSALAGVGGFSSLLWPALAADLPKLRAEPASAACKNRRRVHACCDMIICLVSEHIEIRGWPG